MVATQSQLPLPPAIVNLGYIAEVRTLRPEDKTDFASRLAFAMASRGVKAPTLANKIGMTRQGVYKWLKRQSMDVDGKTLLALCNFLGVRCEWLMMGDEPMYQSPILADEEKDFILLYRDLAPDNRARLKQIAITFMGESTLPPGPHRPYGRRFS